MNTFLHIVAIVLSIVSASMSVTVIFPVRQPASPIWWGIKMMGCTLAPFFAMASILGVALAIVVSDPWIVIFGTYSAIVYLVYLYRVNVSVVASTSFDQVYGADWQSRIADGQKEKFLPRIMMLHLPKASEFQLTQDISFAIIPGTTRELLCDVWQPATNIPRSGLAFIYIHGSAWTFLDKDVGTRPFFQHLVSQGHVIMDVAYRLFPETDMEGMVNDVYRAIAWMKVNALSYQVNPDDIVLGGGSAGGHLALIAAYASDSQKFVPAELRGRDLAVRAVISEYGPTDLEALYYHTGQHITTRDKTKTETKSPPMPGWILKMMGENYHRLGMDKETPPGTLPGILGCHPDECPQKYRDFSPVTYVHKGCPPTLIIQGEHDLITSVAATRNFYLKLLDVHVPAIIYVIPQTDHAFDLILPKISPVAHAAFYVVERFLALQVTRSGWQCNDETPWQALKDFSGTLKN